MTALDLALQERSAERAEARALLADTSLIEDTRRGAALTLSVVETVWTPRRAWKWLFVLPVLLTGLLCVAIGVTLVEGIGAWGNNIPVAWAFGITNFVWWIGIGHAGTFISAFLLLLNQPWRNSINRVAEAMTLFALVNAGLFPLLHLGRPWFGYWLIPYPATTGVWPNFLSSLPWDVAAVSTYFTISLLFWYVGLIPDLATVRDAAPGLWRRRIYGVFAMGWRGSRKAWQQHRVMYLLLAGLATPLVISVHSIVSLDFSITQLPGWHSTIFPPFFVAGAIYSGFAMVLMLLIPVRRFLHWEAVITDRHLDLCARLLLTTGLMVGYSYLCETFLAWYGGDPFERYALITNRAIGSYRWVVLAMMACNLLTPQLFWWRRCRRSPVVLFCGAVLIWAGMWCERFTIIVGSLSRDFLPANWHAFHPTWVDWGLLTGSLGLFALLFLLFLRWVPAISANELQAQAVRMDHDAARS